MAVTKPAKDFIKKAITRPGALTAAVGGPPSQNLAKVQELAKGNDKTAQQARFYLDVLRPAAAKLKKGK